MTQRRMRVKVRGLQMPSPVVVAMEKFGVAFAAAAQAGKAGAVLDEQGGFDRARHGRHVGHVERMNHGGVLVAMLGRARRLRCLPPRT
jgi:hypothetical protein